MRLTFRHRYWAIFTFWLMKEVKNPEKCGYAIYGLPLLYRCTPVPTGSCKYCAIHMDLSGAGNEKMEISHVLKFTPDQIEMFCGEEERVPDSVSGASDGESQDDYDLMESDCDEDYSELSAFCM